MHVVPVPVYEPPDFHPHLTDFDLNPWIKFQKPIEAWVTGVDYDLYTHFPSADNATHPTWYIVIHEPQDVTTSPLNKLVCSLTPTSQIRNEPSWRGNIIVFKTEWGMEIQNVTAIDVPLIKNLVATYVLSSLQ